MKMYQLINECKSLIPKSETWALGEPYGEYNISDYDADVDRVLFCVTPTDEVVRYFMEGEYDLLLSHHPFFVPNHIPHLIFHTAFDCCEDGLNDMWKKALGVKDAQHFDRNLGWSGNVDPISFEDLVAKVKRVSGQILGECFSEKETIESVVICTGLGGLVMDAALFSEADCYILGENVHSARDLFSASIEIGHTLSERIGIDFFRGKFRDHDVSFELAPLDCDYFAAEVYRR